ncbi:hypothetical protein JCM10049v2_005466 [Rhodotorula toruloides]
MAQTRYSVLKTRLIRFVDREGAIRLPSDAEDEEKRLPWVLSREEASREGYTNLHLLGECIAASIWNALCLFYLLHPSFLSSRSPTLLLDPTPNPEPAYLYALTFLTLVPLAIGVSAGSAALWSDEEADVESRKGWGGAKRAVVWIGTVDWDAQYQAEMAVILIVLQAFLVKSGSDSSFPHDSRITLSPASTADLAALEKALVEKDMRTADEQKVKIVVQFCA